MEEVYELRPKKLRVGSSRTSRHCPTLTYFCGVDQLRSRLRKINRRGSLFLGGGHMLEQLSTIESVRLMPEGEGTIKALSRIGYQLKDALADLVDNSIDAGARRVEITLYRDDERVTSLTIADDGHGMTEAALRRGMQFAARTDHDPGDLGAFGLGLKSASFSQCETLTVISRSDGKTSAARWSVEQIGKDWTCEFLESHSSEREFLKLCLPSIRPTAGTLVVWDRLTRLSVGGAEDDLDEFLATAVARIETHLGLVFHRFIAKNALNITLVTKHVRRTLALPRTVKALDPFAYPRSGAPRWPQSLNANLPGVGAITMDAHIWPAGSLDDGFLLGGRNGVTFQGFYFYRNNRIIQIGGWNGVVRSDVDPDLILARVSVELPRGGLSINVQKSGLQVTAAQSQAFLKAHNGSVTFEKYLDAARATCAAARRAHRAEKLVSLVPGQGMPMPVRTAATKILVGNARHQSLDFVWETLDQDQVFHLDVTETRIVLNKLYRRDILGDQQASGADVPLFKMLMFLLFRDDFERLRFSAKRTAQLEICNSLLLEALKR